jgi:Na+/melibiose symporter-like transporter
MSGLNYREQRTEFAYGSLQFANTAFAAFSGVYLPFIYLEQHQLSPVVFAAAIILAAVLQALTAPAIGAYVQASGLGAMRATMMLLGAIPFAIGFALVSMPPSGTSPSLIGVWLVATLILANVSRSVFEVSYTSMLADLSSAGLERTRLANFRQIFATLGEAAALLLPSLGMTLGMANAGFAAFGLVMGAWVLVASTWMRVRLAKDPRFNGTVPLKPSQPAALASGGAGRLALRTHLGSRPFLAFMIAYAIAMIGVRLVVGLFPFLIVRFAGGQDGSVMFMGAFLAGSLIGLPVWARVAARWGRTQTFRVSLVVSGFARLAVIGLAAGDTTSFLLLCVAMSATSVAVRSFGVALQADLVDLEEQRLGLRVPASIAGIYVLVTRASQDLGTALVGIVILATRAVDPAEPNLALLYVYGAGGCAISLLAAHIMRSFPSHPVNTRSTSMAT